MDPRPATRPPDDPHPGRRRMDAFVALPSDQRSAWLAGSVAVTLLVFLVGPLLATLEERQATVEELVLFACLAGFVGLYLWAIPSELAGNPGARPATVAAILAILAVVISLVQPESDWTVLFIATGAAAGRIPAARSAVAVTVAVACLAGLVLLAGGSALIDALESGFEAILAGLVVLSFSELQRTIRELRRAQAQAERLAVTDERLRIARDVHDLLGHSLSVIALKVELAERLVDRDPPRAKHELRDVEAVTRSSLRDVREAVAGYRRVTLDAELTGARMALSAAGVAADIRVDDAELDEATDRLLGWIVREGVTNVVRHSGASRCAITVTGAGDGVLLEIVDGGSGDGVRPPEPGDRPGSGLAGIRERVAAAGGRVEAGPADGPGFRLAAWVPFPSPVAPVAGGPTGGGARDTRDEGGPR